MKLAKFSHFVRVIPFLETLRATECNYLESSTKYFITLASIILKPPCCYLCISVALTSIQLKPPCHYRCNCVTLKTIRLIQRPLRCYIDWTDSNHLHERFWTLQLSSEPEQLFKAGCLRQQHLHLDLNSGGDYKSHEWEWNRVKEKMSPIVFVVFSIHF